jgi:hypothetical membrane protein
MEAAMGTGGSSMAVRASAGHVRVPHAVEASAVDVRVPGLLFFAVGAAFITVTMLAASIAPGYDFHGAAISDLGVIEETALIFNALLVAIGALNVAGGYLFYRSHGRRWLLGLYVAAGIGAAGAGLMPLSSGGIHSLFALLAFLFVNLEAVGTAAVVPGPMRLISVVAGAIGLVYLVVMVIGDAGDPAIFGAIGHGGSERMIAYPGMLWILALGGYLMARPIPAESRHR